MASSCYKTSGKSTKSPLDQALLNECIIEAYGEREFREQCSAIRVKCNQKCTDMKRALAKKEIKNYWYHYEICKKLITIDIWICKWNLLNFFLTITAIQTNKLSINNNY